jgi:phosphohistidine swiveling domain-containing protein
VTCGYFNEPARTFSEYEKMLSEMVLGNPKAKYVQIVSQLNVDLAKRKELVRTLGPREKKIADIASEVTLLKDYSKESYNEIIYNSEKMFEEIAKRTKKTPFFIKQLDPSETIDLLCNKKEFGDEVLKRAKNSIIFNNTFGISVILGEEVDLLQKQFLSHNKVTEFRGRVASKGFVTGSARVVLTNDDFKKVKKGDILVVQNTNPGYVPLMNVAGGIVAEDGGITAHVSVTSREMGVPCVVGIVGVTKLIKDGDLIEVDAVKGIVKKISKS